MSFGGLAVSSGTDPHSVSNVLQELIDGATDSILRIHALRPDRVHLAHHEQPWLPVWDPPQ